MNPLQDVSDDDWQVAHKDTVRAFATNSQADFEKAAIAAIKRYRTLTEQRGTARIDQQERVDSAALNEAERDGMALWNQLDPKNETALSKRIEELDKLHKEAVARLSKELAELKQVHVQGRKDLGKKIEDGTNVVAGLLKAQPLDPGQAAGIADAVKNVHEAKAREEQIRKAPPMDARMSRQWQGLRPFLAVTAFGIVSVFISFGPLLSKSTSEFSQGPLLSGLLIIVLIGFYARGHSLKRQGCDLFADRAPGGSVAASYQHATSQLSRLADKILATLLLIAVALCAIYLARAQPDSLQQIVVAVIQLFQLVFAGLCVWAGWSSTASDEFDAAEQRKALARGDVYQAEETLRVARERQSANERAQAEAVATVKDLTGKISADWNRQTQDSGKTELDQLNKILEEERTRYPNTRKELQRQLRALVEVGASAAQKLKVTINDGQGAPGTPLTDKTITGFSIGIKTLRTDLDLAIADEAPERRVLWDDWDQHIKSQEADLRRVLSEVEQASRKRIAESAEKISARISLPYS